MNDGTFFACVYTGDREDKWDWTFTPPITNFMAYTRTACASSFTSQQIGVMHSSIVLFMATGGYPLPGINGSPWYNKNIIQLSGTVYSGEDETWYSSERIEVAEGGESHTVNTNASVDLTAQESITLYPGFTAHSGSEFHAEVEIITNCSDVRFDQPTNGRSELVEDEQHHYLADAFYEVLQRTKQDKAEDEYQDAGLTASYAMDVYPNPFEEVIRVNISNEEPGTLKVELFDLSGKLINSLFDGELSNEESTLEFRVENLTKGIYLLKIQNNANLETVRILKED